MSFKVIKKLGDDSVQAELMPKIESWYQEVRKLLHSLPPQIHIYFFSQDDPGIMPEFGVGGYAYSPEILSLGFALNFEDKEQQIRQLKSTVYHEALHIAQGYTGSGESIPMIECMVYEGLATVFERELLGNHQPYGEYPEDKIVQEWINAISEIKTPWKFSDYSKWGFVDEKTGEKWRLYKAGTWFIDRLLAENKQLSLLDLTRMNAQEILKLGKDFI